MRKSLVVAAVFAVSGLIVPVASAGSGVETVTFVLVRTTSGPSNFNVGILVSPGPGGGLIGEADAYVRSGRVSRVDGGVIVGQNPKAQGVDAGNLHIRTCGYNGTCNPGPSAASVLATGYSSDGDSAGDVNALYFVVRGTHISVKFSGTGWVLRKVPLTFRNQATQRSATASASVAGIGGAVTEGGQAAGGKTGSIAVAELPCSISEEGLVARGVGSMTLTGGVTRPKFTCPAALKPPILASYAPKSTTWRLTGWAAGDTTLSDQALLIIDQPTRTTGAAK